ncbi:lipopolysaccharide kinase InaA family protein [Oceanicoccus sagamiensis]|uniref:Non-specific serine/threonine protein kinase n=1 Tax=Oceanicoccus sagamiensis TaxID=716816 RepID=A0A1X9NBS4_9GAMM|nr:lipopolysaccharide kinase InaA family protein [Oceanicoccus sagamiensis]ARN73892.1 hypothetical protein BST96_07050 [Oceanicoccus sagamiensis]
MNVFNNEPALYTKLDLQCSDGSLLRGALLDGYDLLLEKLAGGVMPVFDGIDLLKEESSRQVFIGSLADGNKVFTKMYRENGFLAWMTRMMFSSKAERSHRRVKTLLNCGLQTPSSIGYLNEYNGQTFRSYHFSEYIDGVETLEGALRGGDSEQTLITSWIDSIISQLSSLHGAGYCHGDTKLSNFLCKGVDVYFVDLDGVGKISKKRTPERDIARFIVGLSEINELDINYKKLIADYKALAQSGEQLIIWKIETLVKKFQHNHKIKYGREPAYIELNA